LRPLPAAKIPQLSLLIGASAVQTQQD